MSDYNDGIIPEPCLRLDYGFGQEYASVELGDGTGYVRVTDDLRSEHYKMKRWYDDVLREALDENAKLRELAAGVGHLLFSLDVDYCAACPRDSINHPCPVYTVDGGECLYKADLRELGLES